jgi:hypothetical protein
LGLALYSKPEKEKKETFIHESLGRVWVLGAAGHRGELSGLIWFMA